MSIKLGNTSINSLGVINKGYLGTIEIFSSVFVSLWQTTTANETITLPTPTNYKVDWGDGTVTTNTNSHQYLTANQYTIKISGVINNFAFDNGGDKDKILEISKDGLFSFKSDSFWGCSNIDITSINQHKTTGTNLNNLFRDCSSLVFNSSVNNIDFALITSIANFFRGCSVLNLPINFNTDNVVSFTNMFFDCVNFNSQITLGTSTANSLQSFLYNCINYNQPINFVTPLLKNTSFMFFGCVKMNSSINIDADTVTNMSSMFRGCSVYNQPINFNTPDLLDASFMFYECLEFNQPLNIDTSKVTTMQSMLRYCQNFNQPLAQLSFVSVTRMDEFLGNVGSLYDVNYMDDLYIKLDQDLVFANMVNINLTFGAINYTAAGAAARASLVSKGFIITSGIQV